MLLEIVRKSTLLTGSTIMQEKIITRSISQLDESNDVIRMSQRTTETLNVMMRKTMAVGKT